MIIWKPGRIAKRAMYVTTFMIGLGFFVIGIMYLIKGESIKAAYFIVAFIIAEVLALSFRYCLCIHCCGFDDITDSSEDYEEFIPDYVAITDENSEEQRMKHELYNNEPYSALVPKAYGSVDHNTPRSPPRTADYNSNVKDTKNYPPESSSNTLGHFQISYQAEVSDSYNSKFNEEFPVLRSGSEIYVDIENDPYHLTSSYHEYHPHPSISRYNSFQSNSLPAYFKTDIDSSFESFGSPPIIPPK